MKPREMMHELVAQREIMHEPVEQNLAYRLRELRAHSNISLTELAGILGVTRETISRYVHGKSHIPSERLETLARALHCEERDLQMPPGSPLPRLRFRPARRQNAQSSPYKVDFNMPHYLPVSADELA
jgi:transcriptional regulator with XRE-family HTH domain